MTKTLKYGSLLSLLCLLLLSLWLALPPDTDDALAPTGSQVGGVISSPGDDRDYAYFELPNRLRVLVISDSTAEKAAVSLNVEVGSKDDPRDREGLAHFLEHMLFLGTQKYPEAGEYQAFIAAHGGQHNAYTAFDGTNYFFDINAAELEPALDRFSQFFVSPLFTAGYVDREKHAVESEYRAKYKDEGRRGLDVFKTVVNPAHPFSQFSVGSLETLEDRPESAVRDELLAFYDRHYSANLMSLVVLGSEPLAELRHMVEQRFTAVPDRKVESRPIEQPLFEPGVLPAELRITPEQNIRSLGLTFPIPDPESYWQSKPLHLIADILGHEGEGGLLQYLKVQGWAEALGAGVGLDYRHGATLNLSITLTEAGFRRRDEVVAAVFQAIERLDSEGISQARFDEQRQIGDIRFRYQEKTESVHYVMALAARMPRYPASELLRGPYRFSEYEPGLYQDYLALIRPDNLLLTVTGPGLATDKQSSLYETDYAFEAISAAQLEAWTSPDLNPSITLPAANPFIPEDFSRLADAGAVETPVQLLEEPNLAIWHGDDARFAAPRASTRVMLMSPSANDSARDAVLLKLYAAMVLDSLNPKLYPARLAGFNTRIDATRRGMQISIDGFSDKQQLLLGMLVEELEQMSFDPRRFNDIKQELMRNWENVQREPPYRYLNRALNSALLAPWWDEAQRLEAANDLSLDDLESYRRQFLRHNRIELLAYGNISAVDAGELYTRVQPLLRLSPTPVTGDEVGVVSLDDGAFWRYPVDLPHGDSAIAWYVQGAGDDNRQRVLMALTGQIIRTPFYQSLRTEQQFGYVVYVAPTVLERVPGLSFVVQSPVADAATLADASKQFLQQFGQTADSLESVAFEQHKRALLSLINQPHQNLAEQAGFLWGQLLQEYLNFDRREQLTEALEAVTLPQWQQFYRAEFLPGLRRSLLIYQVGSRELEKGVLQSAEAIETLDAFKAQSKLRHYP